MEGEEPATLLLSPTKLDERVLDVFPAQLRKVHASSQSPRPEAGQTTSSPGSATTATKDDAATYAYVAPEVRFGRQFGKRFNVSVGVELMMMAALSQPTWADGTRILTTGDGLGTFGDDTMLGSFVALVTPGFDASFVF